MPQFTLSELANNAGQTAANAGINLAKEAKGLACGLYKNYTGWATTFGLGTAPPAAFVKGVWDTVCADDPAGLPGPPPSNNNFTGGQCDCTTYHCTGTLQFSGGQPGEFGIGLRGPVTGSKIIVNPDGSKTATIVCRGIWNQPCKPYPQHVYIGATAAGQPDPIVVIQSVTPSPANQPDNCGNPPSGSYPVVPPPPGDLTNNVTINYNDGTDFEVPLTYVQMNNDLDFIVDVGGVGFNFNVGGVSFDWNFGPSGQPTLPPGSGGPGGSGASNNYQINNKLDNITNKIDNNLDIKLDDVILDVDLIKDTLAEPNDCCPEPPDPDTQVATVCPIDDGNTYTGIAGLVSVKLNITKLPLSNKIQFANSSPNVLFAGWLAFTHDGQAYEREPIHFEYNLFVPPKGANGFFYCLTNGAKGRVIYYVKT